MLGTFILSSSVIILGYSGTLTSFLTIRLPPKHLERVSGTVTDSYYKNLLLFYPSFKKTW